VGNLPNKPILPFFRVFCKFLGKFIFRRVGLLLALFGAVANFDLWAGLRVFGVTPSVKRGVSGVKCSGQNPGGGALWFVPLIGCKNHTGGDSQRGRFALSLGRGLSLPVSLSHYRGGVALVGVVSGRSADIRTSFRNRCSTLKSGGLCENL